MDWLAQAATAARSTYDRTSGYLTLGNIVSASWISIWVVICVLIFQDLSRDLVTIEPISTPEAFAKNGYTPEVASRRLHDALNKYAADAGSSMQNRNVESRDELPDFVVPKIDLSLNAIVASIRSALHFGSGQRITGEFLVRDKLGLRLRVDGQEIFSGSNEHDDPDELLSQAAEAVMDKLRPYLVASTIYNSDHEKGIEKADYIINHLKASDVNVEWAYVLKAGSFYEHDQYADAEKMARKALLLNWRNAAAYVNLGNALKSQKKFDEALTQYDLAIEISKDYALAHYNRGVALIEMPKAENEVAKYEKRAIEEYQEAIRIDPTYFEPRRNLGHLWVAQKNFEAAIDEYQATLKCAKTPRRLAIIYDEIGNALRDKSKPAPDLAVEQYWLAVNSDPSYSRPYYDLGLVLFQQDKFDEAVDQFQRVLAINPNDAEAKNKLDEAKDKLNEAKQEQQEIKASKRTPKTRL